ncbi:unnamed protein product [Boreogadus saida]
MRWKSVTIHPGMMHTLMSFLIGFLMKGSGMEQLLAVAFGGIANILNGKSWTNALGAYRMLMQDLLQDGPQTDAAITEYLDKAREHPTGRLWVDCLIRPTSIALNFLRAERQGDFLLQQHCHINWYLRMAQNLPHNAKEDLLAGAHVCRHSDDETAVPADQFGEQTYIKQGKGQGFHSPIGKIITTMEVMKKALTVKGKPIYDMEALFARLLVVGQQRGIEFNDVFDHEPSPVPPSLIDEFGCLRKGDSKGNCSCHSAS